MVATADPADSRVVTTMLQAVPAKDSAVREGTFRGGLPYLAVGSGDPLVFLCGSTPNHRNPKPGLERYATLRSVRPLAAAGFEVFFTNRWPDMDPSTTWAEVAERHAEAILDHFGGPVDVLGHSTGGSLLLQLIATGRTASGGRWWRVPRTGWDRWPSGPS